MEQILAMSVRKKVSYDRQYENKTSYGVMKINQNMEVLKARYCSMKNASYGIIERDKYGCM